MRFAPSAEWSLHQQRTRGVTDLTRAYSLSPFPSGIGVKLPMHPLNAGRLSLPDRLKADVFQVTNKALPDVSCQPHRHCFKTNAHLLVRSLEGRWDRLSTFKVGRKDVHAVHDVEGCTARLRVLRSRPGGGAWSGRSWSTSGGGCCRCCEWWCWGVEVAHLGWAAS